MPLVVDAPVALCWFNPGQASPASSVILRKAASLGIVVPALWHIEVANQLGLKLRRGLLQHDGVDIAFDLIRGLKVETDDRPVASSELIKVMSRFSLTAYDATYLELAMSQRMPLATLTKN